MNDILKQRLVGALVIVAVAAFFWPLIFVGPGREPLDRSSQVPSIPSLQEMQLQAPEPIEGIASARGWVAEIIEFEPADAPSETSEQPLPAGNAADSRRPEVGDEVPAQGLDKDGIPIAWTLQVVSVSKQEKAEELMQQLVDMGYKAYFKAVSHGEDTLYRVYVGPKFEREKMQETKQAIDKKFRVNSIIARYLP